MTAFKDSKTSLGQKSHYGNSPLRIPSAIARFVEEPQPQHRMAPWLSPYALDLSALKQSEWLRRLGDKPQALSGLYASSNRQRLTHSIEVGDTAKLIALGLGTDPDVAEWAGLIHDIGHAPFGHNGEEVFIEFMAGYGGFEGNPQSFRVATRLEGRTRGSQAGFNATRACLDALLKYPWLQADAPPNKPHKYGAYPEDAEIFQWVRDGAPPGKRCLEAQIMDWADDVSYAMSDFEDAMRFGYPDDDGPPRLLIDMAKLLDSSKQRERLARTASNSFGGGTPEFVLAVFNQFVREHEPQFAAMRTINSPEVAKTPEARRVVLSITSELRERFRWEVIAATREANGIGPDQTANLTRYDADLIIPPEIAALCSMFKAMNEDYVLADKHIKKLRRVERGSLEDLLKLYVKRPETLPAHDLELFRATSDEAAQRRIIADRVARMTNSSAIVEHQRWFLNRTKPRKGKAIDYNHPARTTKMQTPSK